VRQQFQRPEPLSISAAINRVKGLFEPQSRNLWVKGEISEVKKDKKGHYYLSLKDSTAQLRAAIWQSTAQRFRFELKPGMAIIARGNVELYALAGDLKLIIDFLEPVGVGAAELALRELKARLDAKGYFALERKKRLPLFPRKIGIVTSATSAAVRDMLELFAQRWPYADIVIRHSRVQGDNAGMDIARAIHHLNSLHVKKTLPLDLIFVGRGGGSKEDLSAFNEEVVAEAIFNSVVPVVTAVGHEVDLSIADLVADFRGETPSAAVAKTIPDRREVLNLINNTHQRLRDAALDLVRQRKQYLDRISDRPVFRKPLERIQERERRLNDLTKRLSIQGQLRLDRAKQSLASLAARLESLSPLNVLTRGYSLTFHQDSIVRSSNELKPGDEIRTKLARGEVLSTVKKIETERNETNSNQS
jgi:exodeoxyribonuclease VII large subunit